jgi:hypothetical protein
MSERGPGVSGGVKVWDLGLGTFTHKTLCRVRVASIPGRETDRQTETLFGSNFYSGGIWNQEPRTALWATTQVVEQYLCPKRSNGVRRTSVLHILVRNQGLGLRVLVSGFGAKSVQTDQPRQTQTYTDVQTHWRHTHAHVKAGESEGVDSPSRRSAANARRSLSVRCASACTVCVCVCVCVCALNIYKWIHTHTHTHARTHTHTHTIHTRNTHEE